MKETKPETKKTEPELTYASGYRQAIHDLARIVLVAVLFYAIAQRLSDF